METAYIYNLIDPRTDEVRYVGKTTHPERRLRRHIVAEGTTPCHDWLSQLRRLGLCPEMKILEETKADDWAERERFWIANLRETGCKLTNVSVGGYGALGVSPSPETRRRISESITRAWQDNPRSISSEHLAALVNGRKATPQPAETRAKIGQANKGSVRSEETRRRISEAKRGHKLGPPSMATRKKISRALRGENNGQAKLTWGAVREIRRRYAEGDLSLSELGRQYGVDTKQIHRVVRNEAWRE